MCINPCCGTVWYHSCYVNKTNLVNVLNLNPSNQSETQVHSYPFSMMISQNMQIRFEEKPTYYESKICSQARPMILSDLQN